MNKKMLISIALIFVMLLSYIVPFSNVYALETSPEDYNNQAGEEQNETTEVERPRKEATPTIVTNEDGSVELTLKSALY